MRIAVGFKVTPDYEALRPAQWAAGAADGVDARYVRRILNCFDESALELALRLREARADAGASTELMALSVGGRDADPYLKTLTALGYERAARVDAGAALDFAPGVTASLLAAFARGADGAAARRDVLLLGCRSGPGDSGTVPFLAAERLRWPCLTRVVEIEPLSDDRLRVTCAADAGLLRVTVRPPCVLAVGNAVVSHLRVPTLTARLAHRDEVLEVLSGADLGVDVAEELRREPVALEGLEVVDRTRPGVVVRGASAEEKARTLFEEHLKDLVAQL